MINAKRLLKEWPFNKKLVKPYNLISNPSPIDKNNKLILMKLLSGILVDLSFQEILLQQLMETWQHFQMIFKLTNLEMLI